MLPLVLANVRNDCGTKDIFEDLEHGNCQFFHSHFSQYFPVIFYLEWCCFLTLWSLVLNLLALSTRYFGTWYCPAPVKCGTFYLSPSSIHLYTKSQQSIEILAGFTSLWNQPTVCVSSSNLQNLLAVSSFGNRVSCLQQ